MTQHTSNETERADLMDDDGENRALRSFLMQYGVPSLTVGAMRKHMDRSGWPLQFCPDFARTGSADSQHLTKGGAQVWIRHLLSMEARASLPKAEPAGDGEYEMSPDQALHYFNSPCVDFATALAASLPSAPPMQASATEQATRPAEESVSNQALSAGDTRSDQQQQATPAPPMQVAPGDECVCDSQTWCNQYGQCHRKTIGAPPATGEVIAWLHDTRVDVIHNDAKELWLKVNHRKVEHYTIPLYEKGGNT